MASSTTEYATIGIDTEENYHAALNELTNYYEGIAPPQEVLQTLQEVNDMVTRYPLSQQQAAQFFADSEQLGILTVTQSNILQDELNAILSASSIEEIESIIHTVESEVIASRIPFAEKDLILQINAQLSALADTNPQVSYENTNEPGIGTFYYTGMATFSAIAGFGLMLAGICIMAIASYHANPVLMNVGVATAFFGFGLFIQ